MADINIYGFMTAPAGASNLIESILTQCVASEPDGLVHIVRHHDYQQRTLVVMLCGRGCVWEHGLLLPPTEVVRTDFEAEDATCPECIAAHKAGQPTPPVSGRTS